jgi:hypothetical protein
MSGKLTALTYSTYTVRHAVTLKWLSIALALSNHMQRTVIRLPQNTVRLQNGYKFDVVLPVRNRSKQVLIYFSNSTKTYILFNRNITFFSVASRVVLYAFHCVYIRVYRQRPFYIA